MELLRNKGLKWIPHFQHSLKEDGSDVALIVQHIGLRERVSNIDIFLTPGSTYHTHR